MIKLVLFLWVSYSGVECSQSKVNISYDHQYLIVRSDSINLELKVLKSLVNDNYKDNRFDLTYSSPMLMTDGKSEYYYNGGVNKTGMVIFLTNKDTGKAFVLSSHKICH